MTPGLRMSKFSGTCIRTRLSLKVSSCQKTRPPIAAMAAAIAAGNVQERLIGARIVAEIGKGRGFQADQRGLVFAGRTLVRKLRRQRRDPVGGRFCRAVRRRSGIGGLALHQAFARGRKAVLELRLREAVVERIAPRGLRIGGKRPGARRLATLSENERQRDKRRQRTTRRHRREPARCRSAWHGTPRPTDLPGQRDHTSGISDSLRPSTHCPNIHRRSAYVSPPSVTATLSFRENSPLRKLQENTKSCRDCGSGHPLFAMSPWQTVRRALKGINYRIWHAI